MAIPAVPLIVFIMFGLGVFSVKPVAVVSNSMEREFRRGDLVLIAEIKPDDVRVGDIIQYQIGGTAIVHRVIEIGEDSDMGRYFIMQGDENPAPDIYPVFDNQIMGQARWRTPLAGWPALWFYELLN